ncbi:MAG: HDOD domain-containing protein [Oscillospiraceae bacterium]|nr:HDOD domain-containing protein [Oscillospiraceae bacterium]
MDLLIVPVPIFDKDQKVEAYMFRYQDGNEILDTNRGPARLDGVMTSAPLDMLNTVGIDTFTMGKPIFVPVTNYMLLANLDRQCSQPPQEVVFLLDNTVKTEPEYIAGIERLKELGFRFAISKITEIEPYAEILSLCDFAFFDHRIINEREQQILRLLIARDYKHITAIYSHIMTKELFEVVAKNAPGLYEGRFYRTPLTKGSKGVSPLQVNLIDLLNKVRSDDFEFSEVATTIAKDPALSVALLKLVNSAYFGSRNRIASINQAVTMLGQQETRKWITTAVAKLLGSDKPSEITRVSLIRAKFSENLAVLFKMQKEAESLFLTGLFSVLDAILDKPMAEALEMVHVSDLIYEALVDEKGDYYPVYHFMRLYESAMWNSLSRIMILNSIKASDVYDCYLSALCWYRDILTDK